MCTHALLAVLATSPTEKELASFLAFAARVTHLDPSLAAVVCAMVTAAVEKLETRRIFPRSE